MKKPFAVSQTRPLKDSLFLRKIGQWHHRSKSRYKGAIVDAERLAEEERMSSVNESDQEPRKVILGICPACSSQVSAISPHA